MSPYLFANAILVGLLAFGAIYHGILWPRSRRDRTVLARDELRQVLDPE